MRKKIGSCLKCGKKQKIENKEGVALEKNGTATINVGCL